MTRSPDATPPDTPPSKTNPSETTAEATPPAGRPNSDATSASNAESEASPNDPQPNDPQPNDFAAEPKPGPSPTPTEFSAASRNTEPTPEVERASKPTAAADASFGYAGSPASDANSASDANPVSSANATGDENRVWGRPLTPGTSITSDTEPEYGAGANPGVESTSVADSGLAAKSGPQAESDPDVGSAIGPKPKPVPKSSVFGSTTVARSGAEATPTAGAGHVAGAAPVADSPSIGNPSLSAFPGPRFANSPNSGFVPRQPFGSNASGRATAGASTAYNAAVSIPGTAPWPQPQSEPRKQRRPWTLRTRLVVAVLLLATVGLAVFGVASVLLIKRSLIDRVDQQLEELTHRGPGGLRIVPPPTDGQGRRNGQDLPTDFAIRSYFPDGTVYLSNNMTDTTGPVLPTVNAATYPQLARQPFTADDQEGKAAWRVRIVQRTLPQGTIVYVAVAQSLDTVEETVSRLEWIEALVGVAALATLGGIGFWVVRLGLRPLTKIEQTAGSIAGGHLYLRVPSDSRTEVGRLGAVLNTMVGRLSSALRQREHSEARLRRFVADASHELRTPLTSIRGFAELNRRGGAPERADVDRLMGRIEDEAIRMGLLVEDLLLLARLDQERALDLTELDLRTLVEDAVHDARARDPDRPVQLDTPDTPVRVTADEHRMRQVITNLVNNAVIHTPPGSPVHVTVGKPAAPDKRQPVAVAGAMYSHARVVLEVVDEGPGVPLEAAPNIFDRFYRVDSARSRRRGGTGLGLAITAAILEAHGGRVELRTAPAQGARFTVLLPLL